MRNRLICQSHAKIFPVTNTISVNFCKDGRFCAFGLIHFRHQVLRFTSNHTWTRGTSFLPCPLFYSALRASVALRATCCAPARLRLAVIDFENGEQQSRSGSDKKRRNRLQQIHKDPIGLINPAKRQVYIFCKVRLEISNPFIHTKLLWIFPVFARLRRENA